MAATNVVEKRFLFEAPPPYEETDGSSLTTVSDLRRMVFVKLPDLLIQDMDVQRTSAILHANSTISATFSSACGSKPCGETNFNAITTSSTQPSSEGLSNSAAITLSQPTTICKATNTRLQSTKAINDGYKQAYDSARNIISKRKRVDAKTFTDHSLKNTGKDEFSTTSSYACEEIRLDNCAMKEKERAEEMSQCSRIPHHKSSPTDRK
ncbi:hypothetical protein DICVIV_06380 [Dictyocaulus viviparus]|uniref:Uncharacterized protein n=1 Tax=Dictyocaulus viviparus TaxID=29172 RepID=A0A0D8XUU9_DICVI|nr:hypothetical protein DICVIV_06380 [Dictyocaulus viviparus]